MTGKKIIIVLIIVTVITIGNLVILIRAVILGISKQMYPAAGMAVFLSIFMQWFERKYIRK